MISCSFYLLNCQIYKIYSLLSLFLIIIHVHNNREQRLHRTTSRDSLSINVKRGLLTLSTKQGTNKCYRLLHQYDCFENIHSIAENRNDLGQFYYRFRISDIIYYKRSLSWKYHEAFELLSVFADNVRHLTVKLWNMRQKGFEQYVSIHKDSNKKTINQ